MTAKEKIRVSQKIEELVAKELSRKKGPRFPPGVLDTLRVLLARETGKITGGEEDTESGFAQSLDTEISVAKAIALCRTQGIRTEQIVDALVDPAALQARAFADLSPEAISGLKSNLTLEINQRFWHQKT